MLCVCMYVPHVEMAVPVCVGVLTKSRAVLEKARQKIPRCPELWCVCCDGVLDICVCVYVCMYVQCAT